MEPIGKPLPPKNPGEASSLVTKRPRKSWLYEYAVSTGFLDSGRLGNWASGLAYRVYSLELRM